MRRTLLLTTTATRRTATATAVVHPRSSSSSRVKRRVVVTGIGAVTPLGNTFTESWHRLISLRQRQEPQPQQSSSSHTNSSTSSSGSSITSLEEALLWQHLSQDNALWFEREMKLAKALPCQVAAPVKLPLEYLDWKRTSRFVSFALLAGQEALQQAGLFEYLGILQPQPAKDDDDNKNNKNKKNDDDILLNDDPVFVARRERTGVAIASGMSAVREISHAALALYGSNDSNSSINKLSPHFVPKVLSNSAAGRVALEYGLTGPNLSASTACAAASHSIGEAYRCIQYEHHHHDDENHSNVDIMLAGGAEASLDPLSLAGFCRLRALSTRFNSNPALASRPFDGNRDGFVMGEGAAVLVLEEYQHAVNRKARILAEVVGYGCTGDAFHITAPDPAGRGAMRAMNMALQEAAAHTSCSSSFSWDHDPDKPNVNIVGYVNAHATSTPKGDEIEAAVIHKVFQHSQQSSQQPVYVSSTKGATGHLLGAAGAVEAAFTIQALVDQIIPHSHNLDAVDPNCNGGFGGADSDENCSFQHVQQEPLRGVTHLQAAMSNSFGFGGTNASLVFRRIKE